MIDTIDVSREACAWEETLECFRGNGDVVAYSPAKTVAADSIFRMLRTHAALYEALQALLPLLCEFEYTVYGNFMGGDPRDFTPDTEDCTPEEIAAWEAACAEWDAGTGTDRGPGCQAFGDGSAITGTGFGLGTTTRKCEELKNARAVLAASRGTE